MDPDYGAAGGRGRRALLWIGVALGFTALGAGGAVVVLRSEFVAGRPVAMVPPAPPAAPAAPAGDVDAELVLTAEQVARVGIKTVVIGMAEAASVRETPGSVTANAYREVKVTPIAPGILTRIHVELGAAVRRGAPLATISSAELADTQAKYLAMQASIEADEKRMLRTESLAKIGAVSRQELEEVTALHHSHETDVAAARQRLLLLGLSPAQVNTLKSAEQIVSQIVVAAPADGVITARAVNLGQVVALGQELFVVTDLSTVWVVGDLYEQDFAAVRVGAEAAITTPAYSSLTMRGRVAYIDPRVDPQSRTAKIRVEVPNAQGRLKLGMYVTMTLSSTAGSRTLTLPRTAVQSLGDRHIVFVPARDEPGKFHSREVRLGPLSGDVYPVLSGLEPGETVVSEGSFMLRAEALRNRP